MKNPEVGGARPEPTGFHRALDSLREEDVAFSLRKPGPVGAELPAEGELDVWLEPGDVEAADAALARAGFHHFLAPGLGRHRFYLSFERDCWLKVDAKLGREWDESGLDRAGRPGAMRRVGSGLARRRFAAMRRLGPVVAVLGPDGAGRASVVTGLKRSIPVAVKGISFVPCRKPARPGRPSRPEPERPDGSQGAAGSRLNASPPGAIRETVSVVRNALCHWARLVPAYMAAWRGDIVLCDHPIDVLAFGPDRTRPAGAVERFIAGRLIPRPDAVIVLALGPEHERWRGRYAETFISVGATIITTAGPPDAALAPASEAVWAALRERRGW